MLLLPALSPSQHQHLLYKREAFQKLTSYSSQQLNKNGGEDWISARRCGCGCGCVCVIKWQLCTKNKDEIGEFSSPAVAVVLEFLINKVKSQEVPESSKRTKEIILILPPFSSSCSALCLWSSPYLLPYSVFSPITPSSPPTLSSPPTAPPITSTSTRWRSTTTRPTSDNKSPDMGIRRKDSTTWTCLMAGGKSYRTTLTDTLVRTCGVD